MFKYPLREGSEESCKTGLGAIIRTPLQTTFSDAPKMWVDATGNDIWPVQTGSLYHTFPEPWKMQGIEKTTVALEVSNLSAFKQPQSHPANSRYQLLDRSRYPMTVLSHRHLRRQHIASFQGTSEDWYFCPQTSSSLTHFLHCIGMCSWPRGYEHRCPARRSGFDSRSELLFSILPGHRPLEEKSYSQFGLSSES